MIVSKKKVLAKTSSRCAYCGKALTLSTMHRDHIVPLIRHRGVKYAFSGRNGCKYPERHTLENIVAACRTCNLDKGPLDLETWRASLKWPGPRPIVFWFEKYKSEVL